MEAPTGTNSRSHRMECLVASLFNEVDDDDQRSRREEAQALTQKLLRQASEWHKGLVADKQAAKDHDQRERDLLLQERQELYRMGNICSDFSIVTHLRQVSGKLQHDEISSDATEEDVIHNDLSEAIAENLVRLQTLVGSGKELPLELRYLADADPDTGVVEFEAGAITGPDGRNIWSEYCATCNVEITFSEPRWRCFVCCEDNVHCIDCQSQWNRHRCCGTGDLHPQLETTHPVFQRLEILAPDSLAVTVRNIFHAWDNRPCFRSSCSSDDIWLTYQQVYHKVSRIATMFQRTGASKILLCFPAGSMYYYYADLACILAGITSVGCPMSPPPEQITDDFDVAVCPVEFRERLKFRDPGSVQFLDLDSAGNFDPFDVLSNQQDTETAIYTEYYTSGSTGIPKRVPITRQVFLRDFALPEACNPCCFFSFLPPYWATDRVSVYWCLYNGYRVGFSRLEPSLDEIVEDIQRFEPTDLIAPTTLLEFLCTIQPAPSLGPQLRHVFCGGSMVGTTLKKFVRDSYGAECIESYGCTECGGIMSEGKIAGHVVDFLRLRDPDSGEWLNFKQDTPVSGELWVRDFNTKDLVEISENGKRLRVLGRSGYAAAFKLENGKWCSLIDIEAEIVRTCGLDLVRQVQVVRNKKGILVLVVVPHDMSADPILLLQQIHSRAALPSESRPKAIIISQEAFPVTQNHKVKRDAVVDKFKTAADRIVIVTDVASMKQNARSVIDLASQILQKKVDPQRSFLDNGGDSISAVQWLRQVKLCFSDDLLDWRSLLNQSLGSIDPKSPLTETSGTGVRLSQTLEIENLVGTSSSISTVASELALDYKALSSEANENRTANHILLTGATGFLGRHVLPELLDQDKEAVIVCLIRSTQAALQLPASERVLAVTTVPCTLKYRQVIHLAANVDHIRGYEALYDSNVRLTSDLLHLKLAPMLFCSTASTQEGQPPFRDGYTQSKYVSEKMVLRCGGSCVWPPFLLWGNKKDWLTRLIQHCIDTGTYPSQLGYLPSSRVETCAKEIVAGFPCSTWDLDLHDLFTRIAMRIPLRVVSLVNFRANAARDPDCALYPVLPLLEGDQIGLPRSQSHDLFTIEARDIDTLMKGVTTRV